ncbi:MAG: hypothetical protein JWR10_3793 [Rubritepida sp.]|nr:hypothetical protein [Rubritepida sp.]
MLSLLAAREKLRELGNHSHTTEKFQNDLVHYAEAFASQGNSLIEVGCFRGGLTAQLALIGKRLGQHLHVVDIDAGYLEVARQSVKAISGTRNVTFHLCDFATFTKRAGRKVRSSLTLIDGDHYYKGVVADIRALLAMPIRPFGVAFHDYSLRYASPELSEIRVDRALHDTLGEDFPHIPIGEMSRPGGPLQMNPAGKDVHFHQEGCSEGVLIEFRNLPVQVGQSDPAVAPVKAAFRWPFRK